MTTIGFQGYLPDEDDPRDHYVTINDLKDINTPHDFDIYKSSSTATDKLPYAPHIHDQGNNIGSCVCNAFASAYACALQRQGHDPSFKPSRLFLYYLARLAKEFGNFDRKGKSDWFAGLATNPPTQ